MLICYVKLDHMQYWNNLGRTFIVNCSPSVRLIVFQRRVTYYQILCFSGPKYYIRVRVKRKRKGGRDKLIIFCVSITQVDIQCVLPEAVGSYYIDHLPILGQYTQYRIIYDGNVIDSLEVSLYLSQRDINNYYYNYNNNTNDY